ncbi:MAG: adenylate cyclase, partial [Alphaproteobacteria bacterium]|nr:adenylate cyclase [Alphaproteobacteria bacterium]
IQRATAARNAELPADQRIVYRIGINQGDVIIDGDDIYGDGVNVAARLQERATPGGICISDRVYGDIRGKIDVGIDDLGDQELKNIPEPVRVYRVLTGPDAGSGALRKASTRKLLRRMALAAAVVAVVAGAAVWQQPWVSEPIFRASPMTAKSSIAVLPFANLSRDPEQEYFSDGITIDIITDLSKFHDLFVISSNSVFAYKGKAVNVAEVSRELGVRYILDGSVQRLGERVRINAQLTDGENGQQLWAERYDDAVADIFDLQEKITRNIVRTLAVRLTEIEQKRAFAKPTDDLKAYDYALRGRALLRRQGRAETFEARKLFKQAVELDPSYASAYAGIGWTFLYSVLYGWTGTPQKAMDGAHEGALNAVSLDGSNIDAHLLLTHIFITRRQFDLALVEAERVIALNPNDARGYAAQGNALVWSSRTEGAILALETALRFDPNMDPTTIWHLGLAYYLRERYPEAVAVLERNVGRRPDQVWDYLMLAATYAQMDRAKEATRAAEMVRRLDPFFKGGNDLFLFRDSADAARVTEGLRKAGLN